MMQQRSQQRLQKIIAEAGHGSRRAAENFIVEGRVRVNGQVVRTLGTKADPRYDSIELEGYGLLQKEPLVYIAIHKPIYTISTVDDPEGRPTVIDVMQRSRALGLRQHEGNMPRVYPVGRLDFNAEGLLLLTNDGNLTQTLLHPSHHVPKTYMVKISGRPETKELQRLRTGVYLRNDDGTLSRRRTVEADVTQVETKGRSNAWLEITIREGRNHQIKRMIEAIGYKVMRLIRTELGGVELGELPAGGWRFLDHNDIATLKRWQHP